VKISNQIQSEAAQGFKIERFSKLHLFIENTPKKQEKV